jgi:hypothetical protein
MRHHFEQNFSKSKQTGRISGNLNARSSQFFALKACTLVGFFK